jgi:membrane protein GlpM
MLGVVPYLAYLAAVYVLVARMRLAAALAASTAVWLVVAGALVAVWARK